MVQGMPVCGPLLALAWAREASVPGWGWAGLRSERGHLAGNPAPGVVLGSHRGERAESESVRQETDVKLT